MRSYTVIVSNEAAGDLDGIAEYIASVFKSASGHYTDDSDYKNVQMMYDMMKAAAEE